MNPRTIVWTCIIVLAAVAVFVAYLAATSGKTATGDPRLSEFHPAQGVVCYAFPGVPESLSCVRTAP